MKKFSFRLLSSLPPEEKKITISTLFTIGRIVLTPFIVVAMIFGSWGAAFWLFVVSSSFDIVDGNLARILNQQTFLGACLDPIADKILLISCFATLAFVQSPLFSVPLWFVLLVLFKELIVFTGALTIYCKKGHLEVRPTILGKATTVAQVWFIIWLFACYFFGWMPIKTYYTALGLLFTLVVLSLFQYVRLGLAQWNSK
ncbi:CDP-alcohol phosphatidyltransferase family protein [bacterium]|nr:CDP-alcohol phosphatidyltransferase family protein [bacterium]